jgi:hypothetical protein
MGTYSVAVLSDNFHIFNLYGQFHFGRNKRHTDYTAVVNGLERIKEYALESGLKRLGCPKYMGCKLGGGDWGVVYAIITEVFFAEHSIDFFICNYGN